MTVLALVLCLLLLRLWPLQSHGRRLWQRLFDVSLQLCRHWRPVWAWAWLLLLLPALVLLLPSSGLLGLMVQAVVLAFCVGPSDTPAVLRRLLVAGKAGDELAALKAVQDISPQADVAAPDSLLVPILRQIGEQYFMVLLGFLLFGLPVAVLCRCMAELVSRQQAADDPILRFCYGFLAWLPTRVLLLLWAFVGDRFLRVWLLLWRNLSLGRQPLADNRALLCRAARLALGGEEGSWPSSTDSITAVRTLWALFCRTGWLCLALLLLLWW